ncbi:MAG: hypothetical protein NTU66_06840 [Elusimicrobia bacterium]|nr:hypothetical protein [Elusimicrobiota bacterium]
MQVKRIFITSAVIVSFATGSFAGTGAAAFMNAGVGAKALAMGSAFVAVCDDTSAIYWNPAGIGRLNQYSVTAMGQSLASSQWDTLKDITPSFQFFGFTFPVNSFSIPGLGNKSNTFGVGLISMGLNNIPLTYVNSSDIIVRDTFQDTENAFFFTYGLPLFTGDDSLYAGTTFKYITQQFSKVDNAQSTGYDMDAGLLYDVNTLHFGLVVQRGAVVTWSNGHTDTSPLTTKFGISKNISLKKSLILTGAADVIQKQDYPLSLNAGGELGYMNVFKSRAVSMDGIFLRTGIDSLVIEDRYGYRNDMNANLNYNAGFGISMVIFACSLQFDYVFSSRPLGPLNTMSVSLYF